MIRKVIQRFKHSDLKFIQIGLKIIMVLYQLKKNATVQRQHHKIQVCKETS